MQDHASILSWLNHLRQLMPATGLVLVGAGTGTGPWVQYLRAFGSPDVTLVEADELRFHQLQQITAGQTGWHLRRQLVAPEAGPVTFHIASHPCESGLLNPDFLLDLWPNMKAAGHQTAEAVTLADLLHSAQHPVNWLLLDCLPAQSIIAGAGQTLDGIEVIAARILVEETSAAHAGAGLSSLQTFLEGRGFQFLTLETGRHPGLGHALFVRDNKALIQSLHARIPETENPEEKLQQQASLIETLQQQLAEAQSQAAEARLRIGQLEEQLNELKLRSTLYTEEMARTEGQIDFIREILLHERAK